MLLLTLAALVSAPVPSNQDDWLRFNDIPDRELVRNKIYIVGFRFVVDPAGMVRDCQVEVPSGLAMLDRTSCELSRKRARFKPARNIDGQPTYGVYRTHSSWLVADVPPRSLPPVLPTLSLLFKSMPEGTKSPAFVRLTFVADAEGKPIQCFGDSRREHYAPANPTALVPMACDQLTRKYNAPVVIDANGNAVPSVQNAVVMFATERKK